MTRKAIHLLFKGKSTQNPKSSSTEESKILRTRNVPFLCTRNLEDFLVF